MRIETADLETNSIRKKKDTAKRDERESDGRERKEVWEEHPSISSSTPGRGEDDNVENRLSKNLSGGNAMDREWMANLETPIVQEWFKEFIVCRHGGLFGGGYGDCLGGRGMGVWGGVLGCGDGRTIGCHSALLTLESRMS